MSKFKIEKGIERKLTKTDEVLETLLKMEINDCVRNLSFNEKNRFVSVANKHNFNISQQRQKVERGEETYYSIWLVAEKKSESQLGPKAKRLHVKEMKGGREFHSDYAPFGVPSGAKCYIDQEFYEEDKMIVDDMKSIFRAMNEEEVYVKNFNKEKEYK